MNSAVWKRVVVPTLITGAAFIGITTRGYDNLNFVTQLLKLKTSSGDSLFKHINIDLCCDECKRNGAEDTCRHKMGEAPHWHDLGTYKHIKEMYGEDEDAYLVETKGLEVETGTFPAFDPHQIEAMFASKPVSELIHERNVFLAIDPAAGGNRSKYALISAIYNEKTRNFILLGAESSQFKEPWLTLQLLNRHIDAIRKLKGYDNCNIIIVPENNLAWEAYHVYTDLMILKKKKVFVMAEDHNRLGIRTNKLLKAQMAGAMKVALKDQTFKIFENFITIGDSKKFDSKAMLKELKTQLINYSKIVQPSKNPNHAPVELYRGKDGYGYDDHVIALQLLSIMIPVFRTSPKYQNLQQQR